jgi:purine-binding chemotaxis protein CheW
MTAETAGINYILFEIAGTTYAVSSQSVSQIEMLQHITPLPNAPAYIDGVVFTRGHVIPAMNLRARFGFEKTPYTNRTRMVVVRSGERLVGLIVDTAREFLSIPDDLIQRPGAAIVDLSGPYLKGIVTIDDRVIFVIDLEEVMKLAPVLEGVRAE